MNMLVKTSMEISNCFYGDKYLNNNETQRNREERYIGIHRGKEG